jgi:hypothetical protein
MPTSGVPRRLTEIPDFAAAEPEPDSLALHGFGLAAALAFLRRRQPRCRRPSEVGFRS